MLIKYMCDSKSDTLRMRYPFQSTNRPISHRNVWSFRIYMIPLRDFVPEWDYRPGTTTGMNSRRHGILWWYHVSKCRAISIADVPDGTNLSFHLLGMIADHRRNLRRVGKIETVPIIQICPRLSQTIGDIYDFEFSLFGKIWNNRETVKSPLVWDFSEIWKPCPLLNRELPEVKKRWNTRLFHVLGMREMQNIVMSKRTSSEVF